MKCMNTSGSSCKIWNSGYELVSGTCVIQNLNTTSDTAQALSTTIKSALIAITGIVVITCLINISGLATLWMTINQQQLFFNCWINIKFFSLIYY